jgi:hypothetical protein
MVFLRGVAFFTTSEVEQKDSRRGVKATSYSLNCISSLFLSFSYVNVVPLTGVGIVFFSL